MNNEPRLNTPDRMSITCKRCKRIEWAINNNIKEQMHKARLVEWGVNPWLWHKPEHIPIPNIRAIRIKQNGGSHTRSEFIDLCCYYNWKCLCCQKETKNLAADHVIPVARGGSSNIGNIQPLCQSCNSAKHTQSTDYRPQMIA